MISFKKRLDISLLLILSGLYISNCYSQNLDLQFRHISFKDGLQNITVHSITEDYEGFIWVGTEDGLHKYNSYEFSVYYNDQDDTTSLRDNNVNILLEDADKNLWIGTSTGLDLFDRNTNSFIHIPLTIALPGKTDSVIRKYYVNYVYEDKQQEIFIGTRGHNLFILDKVNKCIRPYAEKLSFTENLVRSSDKDGNIWISSNLGAYKFNKISKKIAHFIVDKTKADRIASNQVFFVHVDNYNNVWIATDEGLNKIDSKTQKIICYKTDLQNPFAVPNYFIHQIYEDRFNNLWFCSENGLFKYDKEHDFFIHYKNSGLEENSIAGNLVNCVFVDKQGILWVGTQTKGLAYAQLFNVYNFETIRIKPYNKNAFENKPVTSIYKDIEGNLWIGTDGEGLYQFDKLNNRQSYFGHNSHDPKTISTNSVLAILQDSNDDMWFGGYYGGISKLNKSSGTFDTYKLNIESPVNISNLTNDIKSLLDDKKGNILIATNGGGIIIFNKEKKTFNTVINDPNNPNSLCSNWCISLYRDSEGIFWIGTYNGLCRWDNTKNSFTNYFHNDADDSTLCSNFVYSVLEDSHHNIWVGTNKGLCLLNKRNGKFGVFTRKDGFINEVINAILEDGQGNLWISTFKGITKFNIKTKKIKNYTAEYGLQGNQFINGSYFKDKHGKMYFGGMDGFTMFNPAEVRDIQNFPKVFITDFQLFNNTIRVGDRYSLLQKPISETQEIVLKHNQSFISFKYVALDFMHPHQIKYSYIMEGFDNDWHNAGSERIATYTNLDPGKYIFKAKACNDDGTCSESTSGIQVIIKPPIWRTVIAYILYVLLFSLMVYGIISFFRFKDRIKHQLEIQRIESEEQHKLDLLKLRIFTNISHEFRTPLTLILGPAERIIQDIRKHIFPDLTLAETIYHNSHRLLKLINQLLDFRKIDSGSEKLILIEYDIVKFVAEIFQTFQYQAEYQGINFKFNTRKASIVTFFDPDKLEKVIYNLLSNAIKFNSISGSVEINISIKDQESLNSDHPDSFEMVRIEVSDTGMGIPDNEKEKIFSSFYQVSNHVLNKKDGSGIGLALAKEYIQMHKGNITVMDNQIVHPEFKQGSTFVVCLPILDKDKAISSGFEVSETLTNRVNEDYSETIIIDTVQKSETVGINSGDEGNSAEILIVEDNIEMRNFLKTELSTNYKIIEACDGKDGFELAVNEIPDLIISDIIMNEISGIEMCKRIKTDIRTSHIPVILLTALSGDEYQIEGFETGADDYLIKPFNLDLLRVRVKNLIDQRRQLQEKFSKGMALGNKYVFNSTIDQKFADKIFGIIEKNIENPNFDIELLMKETNMSRTPLYKKIKALSGHSVYDLINTIRLKRAADILLNEDVTVYEVAARVGFSDPSVFARSFKRQYNISPSRYAENQKPPIPDPLKNV